MPNTQEPEVRLTLEDAEAIEILLRTTIGREPLMSFHVAYRNLRIAIRSSSKEKNK